MRRIVLDVEYHGKAFFGWQRQGPNRSVQGVLEAAVADLVQHEVTVHGAGRTDRGVHALAMPCHVDLESRLTPRALLLALNARLPQDCAIRRVREVDPRFHARFDALSKSYRYTLLLSQSRSPLLADRAHVVHRPLEIERMQQAAKLLEGTHDFGAFQTSPDDDPSDDDGPDITPDRYGPAAVAHGDDTPPPWRKARPRGTVRTLHAVRLRAHGRLLQITCRGNGFLRGMVRAIAGTLVEVGLGKRPPGGLTALLERRDRREAGANLPAHGLTLVWVQYPRAPFAGRASHVS